MLRQGSVVRARVSDPQGRNPKVRPLVVATPTNEIAPGKPIVAVAITSQFSDPLEFDEVALPYHPRGRAKTGLRKPCIAKCSWLVVIQPEDVVESKGFVTAERLATILKAIGELDRRR